MLSALIVASSNAKKHFSFGRNRHQRRSQFSTSCEQSAKAWGSNHGRRRRKNSANALRMSPGNIHHTLFESSASEEEDALSLSHPTGQECHLCSKTGKKRPLMMFPFPPAGLFPSQAPLQLHGQPPPPPTPPAPGGNQTMAPPWQLPLPPAPLAAQQQHPGGGGPAQQQHPGGGGPAQQQATPPPWQPAPPDQQQPPVFQNRAAATRQETAEAWAAGCCGAIGCAFCGDMSSTVCCCLLLAYCCCCVDADFGCDVGCCDCDVDC